jgi:cell wall-associated NlpC family hydrolase
MDTRGLIHFVYRIHGYPIGTDGASLKTKAEHVSKKELQPGDILVFHGESEDSSSGGRFYKLRKE